jgi:DegV family protein with EDD domain
MFEYTERFGTMRIKIVTDSTADLPIELAEECGITIVPLYVRFGDQTYRDRIEITEDEFYKRLLTDPIHPNTSQPTPQDFVDVYRKLSKDTDGILSIHISNKLSGTYNSALQAKEIVSSECKVEVVDSEMVSMGLGLLAVEAATLADSGKELLQIVEEMKLSIHKTHLWALFDTLKYLALGGRIGKAKAFLGAMLNIKPVLSVKDGEMVPSSQPRTRAKGIDTLFEFVIKTKDIQDLSVMYTTTPEEALSLADRIGATFERDRIRLARIGPAIGVHAGPGALGVALRANNI